MCVSSIVLMTVGGPIVLNRVMLSSNRFEGIELPRRGRVRIVSALRMHFDCQRLVKAAAKRRSSSPGETSSMLVKIPQTIPNGSIQPLAPPRRTGPRRTRPVGGGAGQGVRRRGRRLRCRARRFARRLNARVPAVLGCDQSLQMAPCCCLSTEDTLRSSGQPRYREP